jgi:3-hydroxyacyl-CoA dehydrogenase
MTPHPLVTYRAHERVFVVTIDNPPVNALGEGVPESVIAAIDAAEANSSITAIIIICAGRTFVAGADIKMLERAASGDNRSLPNFRPMLRRLDACAKPTVMAMHGTALGGGLELAMAGSYRMATPSALMGLPEVTLGIIPGGEGTQRLPRLLGVAKALDMVVTAKRITAQEALGVGLVDEIAHGDLLDDAIGLASRVVAHGAPHPRTSVRQDRLGTGEANAPLFAAARELARDIWPHQSAPLAAITAIEAATTLPFTEGSDVEAALFAESVQSEEARTLIRRFFAERAAAKGRRLLH